MASAGSRESVSTEALISGDSWMWAGRRRRAGVASPDGAQPSQQDIRAYLDAAREPVLRDRARVIVGALFLITIVFLTITYFAGNPVGWVPQLIRIVNLAVLGRVFWMLRPGRSVESMELATLFAVSFSSICAGTVSTIEGDAVNAALGMLALTLSCATFLPWRTRMQVALAVIAALAMAGNIVALQDQVRFTTAITAATAGGAFLATIYMVWTLQEVRQSGIIDDLMRRRAEDQLRIANDALEQRVQERTAEVRTAMHELEIFNYSVSHDLRSPLRVIHGMTQLIEDEFPGQLDEQTAARFVRVKLATRRLGELMDAILARSRVSQAEMHLERLNLSFHGDAIMAELRADHPERQVAWTRPDRLPALGDSRLVHLVMENLLDNAWKFTRGRDIARIELDVQEKDGRRTYFVRDNGVGFDKKHASKLFENFQRFHGDEYEGHGIGLAMARRIIERHGGVIRAETEPGVGTTIYFTLGEAAA